MSSSDIVVTCEKTNDGRPKNKQIEEAVDADIKAFDEFFQATLLNDPMTPSERAIIKTYLGWKLGVIASQG